MSQPVLSAERMAAELIAQLITMELLDKRFQQNNLPIIAGQQSMQQLFSFFVSWRYTPFVMTIAEWYASLHLLIITISHFSWGQTGFIY